MTDLTTKRLVTISVRDFALPSPRVGSIELHSGYGKLPTDGQLIHLRVQEEREKSYPNYSSEVFVKQEFTRDKYRFQVGGRMDGFFEAADGKPARIEEIKTAFGLEDLLKKLSEGPDTHPYCLQLKTYGYFHWLAHNEVPELVFHLVSTRDGSSEELKLSLDVASYEGWLEKRLDELVIESKQSEAHSKRRRKLAKDFEFPFESPRSGQRELIAAVEKSLEEKTRLLLQAPTGLGKTVGVLYPSLKQALERGQSVVYVTPKNSQHLVAEDAIDRFEEKGTKVRSLTVTAKSKLCFKAEALCNPEYCEFARDYYTKVAENNVSDILAKKRKLTASTFKKIGEELQVCPFELQFEAMPHVDTVICDYNYVFSPHASIGRMTRPRLGQKGRPNLVVDEAHNLYSRGMDYYSPALSSLVLEKIRGEMNRLDARFRPDAEQVINDAILAIRSCKPEEGEKPQKITPPLEPFLEQQEQLQRFLSRYLEADVEIEPRDPVLQLYFYWSQFTAALDFTHGGGRGEFFTTFHPHPSGGIVRITCCDASQMLAECYDEFENVVAFSATMKPFEYYIKLSGLSPTETKTAEFETPFSKSQRKLLLIPQISTKFSARERNYSKVAEVISRVSAVKPGNYFAFFPSFDFMERVISVLTPPPGFTVLQQHREMRKNSIDAIIDHLKSRSAPTLVFAVQGGVFSEGVDYPGDTVIGAFVVGPPLPSFDIEREEKRRYYQEHYQAGFEYAYTYPAMAKAVQAAGRVIRTETDKGLIVLMDDRFLQKSYTSSMPKDWFVDSPRELVPESILKEVQHFWEEPDF